MSSKNLLEGVKVALGPGECSGGFRNSERGVQPLAREARPQIFGLPRPLSVTLEVQTEYLEAQL